MEASGGNGQAVADEATACEVESPVDEATLAVLGLSVDKGEARVSTPAVLGLPANEGEARVGISTGGGSGTRKEQQYNNQIGLL